MSKEDENVEAMDTNENSVSIVCVTYIGVFFFALASSIVCLFRSHGPSNVGKVTRRFHNVLHAPRYCEWGFWARDYTMRTKTKIKTKITKNDESSPRMRRLMPVSHILRIVPNAMVILLLLLLLLH